MGKAALAGAAMLVLCGAWDGNGAWAQTPAVQASYRPALDASGGVASGQLASGLARFKSALRLTPEQERHWPRVEAALRAIVRSRSEATEGAEQGGLLRNIGSRATAMVLSAASLKRLASAAQPLIRTLDAEQKDTALQLARSMGFGDVAARLQ